MAKYLFERPNFTDIESAKNYLWRLVEALEHLPDNNDSEYEVVNEVIEEANFQNGFYRKWKDGVAEMWVTKTVTIGNCSKWGGNASFIYASDNDFGCEYYTGLFKSVPRVQVSVQKDSDGTTGKPSVFLATVSQGTENSSPTYKFLGLSDNMGTATIEIYATGRWK